MTDRPLATKKELGLKMEEFANYVNDHKFPASSGEMLKKFAMVIIGGVHTAEIDGMEIEEPND